MLNDVDCWDGQTVSTRHSTSDSTKLTRDLVFSPRLHNDRLVHTLIPNNWEFEIYDGDGRRKRRSPQNITWLYHKSFAIIQSRLRPTMWAKYPKNKLVRAVSKLK